MAKIFGHAQRTNKSVTCAISRDKFQPLAIIQRICLQGHNTVADGLQIATPPRWFVAKHWIVDSVQCVRLVQV